MDTSWVPNTRPYEEAMERDFAALGLRIRWIRFLGEKLENEISKARDKAKEAGESSDEAAFKARRRTEESAKRAASRGARRRGQE